MVNIQFSDLSKQHECLSAEISCAFKAVIKKGDFVLGQELRLFEKEFASFCGAKYAVGTSSGTAALFLALLSLGIGKGDEVIIPDFTFIATAFAVSYTQAKPVFVDIEEDTYNIDIRRIEKAINKRTKAIIPVHIFGQPAKMQEIKQLAKAYNLKVIEDAAQAHGASLRLSGGKWVKVGGIADIGCFSFYPSKNLGAMGDAGAIVTNNKETFDRLLVLRDCGRVTRYEHNIIGYNSRLDTLQAAILRIKLRHLSGWNRLRQQAAVEYNKLLQGIAGVETPFVPEGVKHVYHVYAVSTKERDRLFNELRNKGIGVIIHYPYPLHLQKAYSRLGYKQGDFPVAENVCRKIISLPIHPYISKRQLNFVASSIKGFIEGNR